jgi:uncharacterized OsmC-like protein
MSQAPDLREYEARAASTEIFGRVLCSARTHHFIVDGPVWNDCPHEEVTPGELFLSSVASCGVELMQMLAKRSEPPIPLQGVRIYIYAMIDRNDPVRTDITLFNRARVDITLKGVTGEQAAELVSGYKARCPLMGTFTAATPSVQFEVRHE